MYATNTHGLNQSVIMAHLLSLSQKKILTKDSKALEKLRSVVFDARFLINR